MIIDERINKLTGRTWGLELKAQTFEEERILKEIVKGVEKGKSFTIGKPDEIHFTFGFIQGDTTSRSDG